MSVSSTRSKGFNRLLLCATAIAGCLAAVEASAAPILVQDRSVTYAMESQPLAGALLEYGRVSGVQIIFTQEIVAGLRAPSLRGSHSTSEALTLLLSGSGLRAERTQTGAVMIVRGAASGEAGSFRTERSAQPEPETTQVGEIVVTALRRSQRLQDVPASMVALTADNIKASGGQDLRDYLTSVPGVNFAEGSLGQMRVTIRGVSDGIGGNDPLAGIYIDETPITESFFATLDPDVYDIDRVEVLRGPQGTLYGSSSMGGTVRIITKKPRIDVYEGAVEGSVADVSHGGVNQRVDGVINVPLVEGKLAFRASAGYRRDEGWIDDVVNGDTDVNTIEKSNLRGQLLFEPSPDTTITLGVLHQKEDLGYPAEDDVSLPDYQVARRYRPFGESEANLVSLTLQHEFDGLALISATNYLTKDVLSAIDVTASMTRPTNGLLGVTLGADETIGMKNENEFSLFTQEVRLASTGENRLDYVLGAYYSDGTTDAIQVVDFENAPTASAKTTGSGFFTYDQEYRVRQIAGFGELTYNASEQLSFTAGLRVFNVERRDLTQSSGVLNGGSSTQTGRASSTNTQQKYQVQYRPTRDNLVYVQAAQGYRNGGPTGNFPLTACAADLAALGYDAVPTAYGPDKLWNYEIGSKNTLLDRRMTLNGALYYVDWSDIQNTVSMSCGFGFSANSGKAVSKGFEIESTYEPIQGLTLAGGVSYTDAELKEASPGVKANAGDPLPLTAPWSWNFSAQYRRDIGGGLDAFIRGEITHVGDRWNAYRAIGPAATEMDAYDLVNLRLGVRNDRWSVALFASNLLDERAVTMRTAGSRPVELVARPRTIGLNARVGF
jgi:iron complex outermembrane receptor protein